jgi:hypothetical protein
MAKSLFMMSHSVPEGGQGGGDEGRSKYNSYEVQLAVGLARWVRDESDDCSVGAAC